MRKIILYFCLTFFLAVFFLFYLAHSLKKPIKDKILLVCLDGATWNLIKPLIDKNELPNFRKMIENGASGILFSKEAYSPPCWTSIGTGKESEKHGVHNFSDFGKSRSRYLWDILSERNIKVGVYNWLGAPSFKKINGVIYTVGFPYCVSESYPKYLMPEIDKVFDSYGIRNSSSVELYKIGDKFYNAFNKLDMCLIKKFKPTFIAVGFATSNPYQHRYWSALEPQYFDITKDEVIEKGEIINGYYKKIDEFIAFFIKNNYTIFFVSDHGFNRNDMRSGPHIIKYVNINTDLQHINFLMNVFLEKLGMLKFIHGLEGGGQIDFLESKAYYYNSVEKGVTGIRINRKVVEPSKVMEVRQRVCTALREAHFEDYEKVFLDVKENETSYSLGLPDIVFKLGPVFKKENIFFKNKTALNIIPKQVIRVFNEKGRELHKVIFGDKEYSLAELINFSQTGVHEHEGVIIMTGNNIRKKVSIVGAKLCDIAPTILYLLGLPVAKDMDGNVLVQAIEESFAHKYPIKFIGTYETNQDSSENYGKSVIMREVDKDQIYSLGYSQ